MPNVMAAQPNIRGALCDSLYHDAVWLTPAAGVPCSNAANIEERKVNIAAGKIPLGGKSPKMYI